MALKIGTKLFALNTSTGAQSVTGFGMVGTTPALALLLPTGQSAEGISAGALLGFGAIQSASSRFGLSVSSENGNVKSNSSRAHSNGHCLYVTKDGDSTAIAYSADADATTPFIDDGFKLDIDNAPAAADYVLATVIGGTDVSNVEIKEFTVPVSTGTQDYTTTGGWQPDLAILTSIGHSTAPNDISNHCLYNLGFATRSDSGEVGLGADQEDNQGSSKSTTIYNSKIMSMPFAQAPVLTANVDSWLSNGIRLNWTAVASGGYYCWLILLKGGQWETVSGTQKTSGSGDGNTQAYTTTFQPTGLPLILTGGQTGFDANDVADIQCGTGAASGTSNQGFVGGYDNNASDPTDTDESVESDECLQMIAAGAPASLNAEAHFDSFNATDFTLDWTLTDATARHFTALVGGDAAAAGNTISVSDSIGVDDSIARIHDALRVISDNVAIDDAVALIHDALRVISDNVAIDDAVTLTHEAQLVVVVDNVAVADDVNLALAPTLPPLELTADDNVAISDNVTLIHTAQLVVSDNVAVADDVSMYPIELDIGPDNVGITDAVTLTHEAQLVTSDNVAITDVVTLSNNLVSVVDDNVAIDDSVALTQIALLQPDDNVAITDTVTLTREALLQPDDNVAIDDDVTLEHLPAAVPSSSSLAPSSSSLSSCEPFVFDNCGRQPIGVAQQLGHEYPLVRPSSDIRYLLADAYLNYEEPADYDSAVAEYVHPFRIKWLFGVGCSISARPSWAPVPVHSADVLIVDADGTTVFDSTTATEYYTRPWGDRLRIYEWITDTDVFRLVVHTKWQEDFIDPRNYPEHLVPVLAEFDTRVVSRQPKRVKSFIVGLQQIDGHIELKNGFNTELVDRGAIGALTGLDGVGDLLVGQSSTQRAGRRFSIEANAGSGLGRFPGCGEIDVAIRRINGITANQYGDFLLTPLQCYWYERPSTVIEPGQKRVDAEGNRDDITRIVDVTPSTIQLRNDCEPCCGCNDYVEVKKAIDKLYTRWQQLGRDAEAARDLYSTNRNRWLKQKNCREDQPQRLIVEASCGGDIGVAYSFCNVDKECKGPLNITITIETFGHSASGATPKSVDVRLAPHHTRKNDGITQRMKPYTLGGAYPTFTAAWDSLDSHRSGRLSFLLRGCDAVDGDSIKITISAVFAGEVFPDITEVAAFEGDCVELDPCGSDSA